MGSSFFRGVKIHEWSTSAKFAEFTYLEKNQLYGTSLATQSGRLLLRLRSTAPYAYITSIATIWGMLDIIIQIVIL